MMLSLAAEVPRISAGEVLTQVNRFRSKAGLPSLRINQQLTHAAQARANDMASRNYFSHTSPSGKTPWEFIEENGYEYSNAAENLATGQRTAAEVQRSWERSSGHRANQLNRKFTETGIGIARFRDGVVVVQIFASPLR
jgi:uncharacterized protein YkwD